MEQVSVVRCLLMTLCIFHCVHELLIMFVLFLLDKVGESGARDSGQRKETLFILLYIVYKYHIVIPFGLHDGLW